MVARWEVDCFVDLPDGYPSYADNIFIIKPDGTKVRQLTKHTDNAVGGVVTWSPNCQKIAYSIWTGEIYQVWTIDVASLQQKQLTSESSHSFLAWTPTNEILFSSDSSIYIMSQDGQNQRKYSLFEDGDAEIMWSRDGTKMVFLRGHDICISDSDGNPLQTVRTNKTVSEVSYSPDSQSIVYSTNSGHEIYVANLEGGDHNIVVKNLYDYSGDKEVNSFGVCWPPWL